MHEKNLQQKLDEALKEAAYYRKLSKEAGDLHLREAEELSELITKLKQTEKRLRENENALNSLINAIDETLLLIDPEGKVLVSNRIAARRLDKDIEQFIGTRLQNAFPKNVAKRRKKHFDKAAETRQPTHFEDKRSGHIFDIYLYPVIEKSDRVSGIAVFAKDITQRKLFEKERDELIRNLQDALSQVKTLSGLLPICASCKKIRNDKGYWEQIETYIRDHSEAEFSHSICPECSEKLYPGLARRKPR